MNILKQAQSGVKRNSPTILAITSVGLFGAAVISAIRNTPKAQAAINQRATIEPEPTLDFVLERAKIVIPEYLDSIGFFTLATGTVLLGNNISARRISAAGSVIIANQRTLRRLREVMVDTLGEDKYNEIKTEASTPEDKSVINTLIVSDGKTRVYDFYSDRSFYVESPARIRTVGSEMHDVVISQGEVSLNDLYHELGLDPIGHGWEIGWTDQGNAVIIDIGSAVDENDQPYLTMTFRHEPGPLY